MKRDERGWRVYAELRDAYGADVLVKQSSSAEGSHLWIFVKGGGITNNDGASHLTRAQAKRVRAAIDKWLKETA